VSPTIQIAMGAAAVAAIASVVGPGLLIRRFMNKDGRK